VSPGQPLVSLGPSQPSASPLNNMERISIPTNTKNNGIHNKSVKNGITYIPSPLTVSQKGGSLLKMLKGIKNGFIPFIHKYRKTQKNYK
jgi:hypothetical protein